jgi:hypothetical protein
MTLPATFLEVTTDAAGAGTATAGRSVQRDTAKLLYAIEWINGTIADGGTATLSCVNTLSGVDKTLVTFGSAQTKTDATYYPRHAEHDSGGTAISTYAMPVVNGDLQLVVSGGGSVTTCGAYVYLMDV